MTTNATDAVDIDYLKQEHIGKVIAKGLAVLYQEQPKFPVDFLSKWLLNYSASVKNEGKLEENQKDKEDLKQKFTALQKETEEVEKNDKLAKEQDSKIDEDFRELINNHEYHDELIVSDFPDFLESRTGVTGVYIGEKNHPIKDIKDDDEDEKAHLDLEVQKINYIGYSRSHQELMKGKTQALDTGITNKVWDVKEEQAPEGEGEGQENAEKKADYIYIPDLVKEPGINYFRLPKLGAYIACPLIYQSSLSEESFDQGIVSRKEYLQAREDQKKAWEEEDTEKATALAEIQERGEDTASFQEEWDQLKANRTIEKEPPFKVDQRFFVVCADTMGQDKGICETTKKYIDDFTKLYAESWQEKERLLLSADIDRQLDYLKNVTEGQGMEPLELVKTWNDAEDAAAEEVNPAFEGDQKDEFQEKEEKYLKDLARLEKVRENIQDENIKNWFLSLKESRVFKYSGILQNILYLLGYKREDINIKGTHCLNWKKVKTEIIGPEFFEKLLAYQLKGPKDQAVQPYAKINKIIAKMEKYEYEPTDNYNLCYGRLLKFIKLTADLRKKDIEIRRYKIEKRKKERQEAQEYNAALLEKKTEDKERDREKFESEQAEGGEGFNEEEWDKAWDENNAMKEISQEEIEDDIDLDCDFEQE